MKQSVLDLQLSTDDYQLSPVSLSEQEGFI